MAKVSVGPAVLALFVCALSSRGVAQSNDERGGPLDPAERSESRVARARMHFMLGMQFFEVRAYRDAIREFELATALAPSADVWFNIGRAREELGEHEQAKAAFERYLRDRVDAPDAEAVRARVAMIDQRIRSGNRSVEPAAGTGSLRIHVAAAPPATGAGSQITLDGKSVREAQRAQPIILPAGRHRLEVKRTGFVPFRAEVSVEPGMLTSAHARLDKLTEAPRPSGPSRSWTWVALGVAGAGVLGTGVLGAMALDRQSEGNTAGARSWARRADAALIGTSVCALAAAILYFVESPSERTRGPGEHAAR